MGSINFRPNKGKKVIDLKKPQKIYIRYRLGRDVDFNASTGVSVLMDNWDEDKQRVKNRSHILDRETTNDLITNLYNHFDKFDRSNRVNGTTPDYSTVKSHFDSYFKETELKKEVDLFTYLDTFIKDAKTKPNPVTKKIISPNTLKDYKLTRNTLKAFNDEVYKIDFNNINLDWYYDFIDWCNGKGFKMNYTGKHIKTVKTFMNNALEDGLTNNISHKSRKFSVYREETDNVYLNESELTKLWKLDLSEQPRKEIARNLFLIGSFTGLRFSDYHFNKENFKVVKGVEMLKIKTEKTNKIVAIPLHPTVKEILEKYNYTPPKMVSQKLNELIKEVVKEVGIDEVVTTEYNRSGLTVNESKFKFEMISTHTARRSFCTNAYLSGMDSLDIMAISGHTTDKNFKKYLKVTAEERAIKMSEHGFFKKSHLKVV